MTTPATETGKALLRGKHSREVLLTLTDVRDIEAEAASVATARAETAGRKCEELLARAERAEAVARRLSAAVGEWEHDSSADFDWSEIDEARAAVDALEGGRE